MKAEEKTTNHKLVTKLIWHLGDYDGEDITTKIFFDMIHASHSFLHVLNNYGVLRKFIQIPLCTGKIYIPRRKMMSNEQPGIGITIV